MPIRVQPLPFDGVVAYSACTTRQVRFRRQIQTEAGHRVKNDSTRRDQRSVMGADAPALASPRRPSVLAACTSAATDPAAAACCPTRDHRQPGDPANDGQLLDHRDSATKSRSPRVRQRDPLVVGEVEREGAARAGRAAGSRCLGGRGGLASRRGRTTSPTARRTHRSTGKPTHTGRTCQRRTSAHHQRARSRGRRPGLCP